MSIPVARIMKLKNIVIRRIYRVLVIESNSYSLFEGSLEGVMQKNKERRIKRKDIPP